MPRKTLRFPTYPFDYVYLTDALKAYQYPRNKIQRLTEQHDIIRVKKGMYVSGEEVRHGAVQKKTLANLLYGPSYISLDLALSYWGLIPERVEEMTSVTPKRNKTFTTPLGIFSYRYLPMQKFNLAVDRLGDESQAFFIATKEKALCDKLYFSPQHQTIDELLRYVQDDLRLDMDEVAVLRRTVLQELKRRFAHPNVTMFVDWHAHTYRR